MAIDQSLKRKKGGTAGSQSDKKKMEQKLDLVRQRLALLDSSSSESDKDVDYVPMYKRLGTAGSQSDKKKTEQKLDLVRQRLALFDSSSSESDKDVDYVPMDKEIAVVVDQEPIVIDCDDADDEEDFVPLRIVRIRVESEEKKFPNISQTHYLQNTNTAKRKTGRPVGSKPTKSEMKQKKQRPTLLESDSSFSGKSDKDDDDVLMVSDVNGLKTCASVEENCGTAMERAKEVQMKLPAEHPSFVKHMLQSHVVRGFWLGLPCDFCRKHLPKDDTIIVLEDEHGCNYDTTYLGSKQGLSGGWKGFAINHDIKVGDVVVFQLVRPTKFKIYILRANKFSTTDGALGLLSLDTCNKKKIPKEESFDDVKSEEDPKITRVSSKVAHSDSNNLVSESIDGIRFFNSDMEFDDVTSFSSFSIVVDNLVIDCRFPDHLRKTYYELCHAQKSFLHKNLLKQINLTLAVGVIMETINIAEGIRACKAHTFSPEDFVVWKKTLESFELLGMNVSFLLKRINDLLGLAAQSRDPTEQEQYKAMKLEQARAGEQMKALEFKLSNLKDALKMMDVQMEGMETNAKRRDEMLQHIAAAPW